MHFRAMAFTASTIFTKFDNYSYLENEEVINIIIHSIESILKHLSDEKLEWYIELFVYFDRIARGLIEVNELGQAMRSFGWKPSEADLQVIDE